METLNEFLNRWDWEQKEAHSKIEMFDPDKVRAWTNTQKQYFVKVFYHLRGHFHDFLWFMANHSPDNNGKQTVIDNITEEFGGNGKLHEQLYFEFGKALGVDLMDEVLNQTTYSPFAMEFNRKHLEWLAQEDWDGKVVAFAAYERLDNFDYADLLKLAKALGLTGKALLFFEVHTKVRHYEMANEHLGLEKIC